MNAKLEYSSNTAKFIDLISCVTDIHRAAEMGESDIDADPDGAMVDRAPC